MILGIGLDIVDLEGFRQQLADPASTFVQGTFTEGEQADSQARASRDPARHLGARYAAKEAFIKAWSTANLGRPPMMGLPDMREIEVVSDAWGRPSLALHGAVSHHIAGLGPYRVHVSLTHDGPTAAAVVILERADAREPRCG
jgi:holo-[acyl-carrier protein] synthase